jgi:phosphoglycolate phosphatase
MIDSMIFDLDGTLWDSRQPVAEARNNVVKKLGLNLPDFTAEDVQKTMGLPMDKVYQMCFSSISREEYAEVRRHLDAEISSVVMERGARIYSEVENTLVALTKRFPLFIVSNCSQRYLATYFDWSGHQRFFKDSLCNGSNGLPKSENIRLIVQRNGLKRPVYIGDMSGDHSAAVEAGVEYIHVDYGFGNPNGECQRIAAFSELTHLFQ